MKKKIDEEFKWASDFSERMTEFGERMLDWGNNVFDNIGVNNTSVVTRNGVTTIIKGGKKITIDEDDNVTVDKNLTTPLTLAHLDEYELKLSKLETKLGKRIEYIFICLCVTFVITLVTLFCTIYK